MIIYYEGLPRSGKSLNCLRDYVIPALAKGRAVFAYVAGLNHEKIAELANIELDVCKTLLTPLTLEQSKEFHLHVKKDSLIVLDEAESQWPAKRQPLEEIQRTYIAEHGQHGHDIILMGQTFNELHSNWKTRVAQKNFYLKREAAGKPDEFSVTVYKPVKKGDKTVFEEVQHIKGQPYDVNYFGAYKSHKEGTTNKETFIDERANVWNNPVLKKWFPIYGAVFVVSCYFVYNAFWGDQIINEPPKAQAVKPEPKKEQPKAVEPKPEIKTAVKPIISPAPSQIKSKSPQFIDENPIPDPQPDLVDNLSQTARIRLSGYIRMGNRSEGFIEWRGDSNALIERLSFANLKALGWVVMVNQDTDMAILQNYHKRYIATTWPIPDSPGRVTQSTNATIQQASLQ